MGTSNKKSSNIGFPPLYRSVSKCYEVTQALHVGAHYTSCKSGVGKPNQ